MLNCLINVGASIAISSLKEGNVGDDPRQMGAVNQEQQVDLESEDNGGDE